jgi:general secretion pathway protein D
MNYTKLPKKVLVLLAAPVLLSLAIPVSQAQSQTETKIRLMAEALRARDSGDLATAKTNLEQLLVLAPSDVTVQRLLAGVNDGLAKGKTVAELAPALPDPSAPVEAVYTPEALVQTSPSADVALSAPEAAPGSAADEMAAAEAARINDRIAEAKAEDKAAAALARSGDYDAAAAKLDAASRTLPVNALTQDTLADLDESKNEMLLQKSRSLLKKGDTAGAKAALDGYKAGPTASSSAVKKQADRIERVELNPGIQPISDANPSFLVEEKKVAALVAKARSQYVAGDVDGAQETFRIVETLSPDSPEAKYFLMRIAEDKAKIGTLNREKTRSQLLQEVANAWQRPGVFIEKENTRITENRSDSAALAAKLESILIPSVSFSGVELGRVISTLSAFSEEFDPATTGTKGVNLVLTNQLPGATVPQVNITLRNLSLKRILDIITQNVGYQYEIQADLILVRPSGDNVNLSTEEFPVSKSALTRMTGVGASGTAAPAASADPFAPAPTAAAGGASSGGEADALKRFLSAAGVNFDGVSGSNLAYDGTRIIVTQTGRNIERIRNILGRYNDIRQVEIEAKFMDVQEGAVDELGVSWTALQNSSVTQVALGSQNRTLGSTFTSSSSGGNGQVVQAPAQILQGFITQGGTTTPVFSNTPGQSTPILNQPPSIPGTVNLGSALGSVAAVTGARIGNFDVTATLRALSLRQGSDLLSAPKVTVLSGSPASITVAQELRYPQSYGEIQSEVGTGGTTGGAGAAAGVTITAGTPQDFTTRNVGVELTVTPTVEEDEYSISLDLNPRVTEFEGFVEYGGQSIAISGSTTVTVPSGFYQPIFSSREIKTRVTVWDGATLVMGGLTREEVKRVNDKTPFLGDVPYLGRLFKSKGEASTKRNLLIFVTANLVSPGGSLKKQELKGVSPNSVFQNPSVVTPGNSENRIRSN